MTAQASREVVHRYSTILRRRLPGGWLRSIEDHFEAHRSWCPMILRNDFSISKNAAYGVLLLTVPVIPTPYFDPSVGNLLKSFGPALSVRPGLSPAG